MKNYKVGLAALSMMFAFSTESSAQSELGNLLGNLIEQSAKKHKSEKENNNEDKGSLLGNILGNAAQRHNNDKVDDDKKGGLLGGLSDIFSSLKQADEKDLVGTWVFEGPAVVYESDDVLRGLGGKYAAEKAEQKIEKLMDKYGLSKNAMTFTFDEDGTFHQKYKRLDFDGTYTVEDKNVVLKYSGRYKQMIGKTQLDGNNLVILMDGDKLNDYLVGIANLSQDPRAQLLSKLLGGFKGTSFGMRFEKQI